MKKFLGLVMIAAILMEITFAFAQSEPITADNTVVTLTNANTEYSWTIPNGTSSFTIQCRTAYDVRCSWYTGKVAGSTDPYWTIKSGGGSGEYTVSSVNNTLYLASTQAGVVVEIIYWH